MTLMHSIWGSRASTTVVSLKSVKRVELGRVLLVTQFCCVTNFLGGVRRHAQSRHAQQSCAEGGVAQQNCATRAYGLIGRTFETAHYPQAF